MHALGYLLADNAIKILEMQEAEWLTETGAQFEAIEFGRAGNMTSQTRGRKGCSKNVRESLEERNNISIHNNPPHFHTQGIYKICR